MAKRGEKRDRIKVAIFLTEGVTDQMRKILAYKADLATAAGLPVPDPQYLIRAWVDQRVAEEFKKLPAAKKL